MSADKVNDYQQFKANVFSFMINRETTELAPSKIKYEGEMKNGFLFLNIHLNYVNNSDATDNNAVFILPTNNFQMLCEVKCQVNNKNANLDIREMLEEQKRKINETSQNVISLGYQYFKINIGTFSKGSKCDLDIKLNIISTNTDERTYQTVIPISKSKPLDEDNFSFKIQYSGNMSVSDSILCGDEAEIENVDYDFDFNVFTIDRYLSVPIIIETELMKSIPNVIQSGMNNEYFIISVLPEFSKKIPKNDFVFVADCSGSMSGERVRNVSNCLLNYLPSLDKDSKFNIIRFGSNYECIFKDGRLVENNDQNLQIAKDAVTNMQADMGGTNLYGPLVEAYRQSEQSTKEGKIVQIFTLTDGGIGDRDQVFQLVGSHSTTHHINSIGVGAGVSNDLVKGLASHSNGNCKFVSKPEDIREVVMDLLNSTQNRTISNPTIKLVGSDGQVIINTKLNGELRSGQMINIFVKKTKSNQNVNIKDSIISGKVENKEITTNTGEIKENPRLTERPIPIHINPDVTKKPIEEIEEKPTERKVLEKTLDGLIQSQASDGSWSDSYIGTLIEFLKESYNNKNFDSKIKTMLCSIDAYRHNDQTKRGDVQSTIIALCIFNVKFKSAKKYWKLMSRKAVEWLESHKLSYMSVFSLISLFMKKNRSIYGDFFEYDFDYEDFQCQFLYITNHKNNLNEYELRNLFTRFATIETYKTGYHETRKEYYAMVTLSSYHDAKEFIKASLLMKIDGKPIYVSFENEDVRYKYKQNYKYMIQKKINDLSHVKALSDISQYQARALMHDSDLFDDWMNLSWNFK